MPNKILSNITSVYTDKSINGWLRGVIWVGTIVVVYVGGKAIYTKLFPSADTIAQQQRQQQLGNDINDLLQTQTQTFPQSQYNNDADSIVAAFSGCDITNNSLASLTELVTFENIPRFLSNSGATVYNILFSYKNDLDVLSLEKAFGTRTIPKHFPCGSGTFLNGDFTDVDLSAAVTKQLTSIEIGMINSMLESKGITKFKF
jgi:hypothetical protein